MGIVSSSHGDNNMRNTFLLNAPKSCFSFITGCLVSGWPNSFQGFIASSRSRLLSRTELLGWLLLSRWFVIPGGVKCCFLLRGSSVLFFCPSPHWTFPPFSSTFVFTHVARWRAGWFNLAVTSCDRDKRIAVHKELDLAKRNW